MGVLPSSSQILPQFNIPRDPRVFLKRSTLCLGYIPGRYRTREHSSHKQPNPIPAAQEAPVEVIPLPQVLFPWELAHVVLDPCTEPSTSNTYLLLTATHDARERRAL